MRSKVLGILGGLGPQSTVYFYELLTEHTMASRDQDHLDVLISSKSSTHDRSAYILGKSQDNPYDMILSSAYSLISAGAEVLALPCNTAHYFYNQLSENLSIPLLDMIDSTVDRILELGGQKAGILATNGTIESGMYQALCSARGLSYAVPTRAMQKDIMSIIYDDIKGGRAPRLEPFHLVCESLFADNCDYIILACTELSLIKRRASLDSRFIDSLEVLAENSISACGKTPVGFK